MQYEQRYRIRWRGEVIEGQYIQTKGNDEDYPTFDIGDGTLLGVHKDAVLGPVTDDCPVDGIERFDIVIPRPELFVKLDPHDG